MKEIFTSLTVAVLLIAVLGSSKAESALPACVGVLNVLGALVESNDTVYTCVGIPLTFDDASLLDGLLSSRDWVFGDGDEELGALLSAQTIHAYSQEGTYTATLTVASLLCAEITVPKTVIVLGNPQFNVVMDYIDCFGNCNAELIMNLVSDNASLYDVVWDAVGVSGNTVTDLCPGDYEAAVTDGIGCTTLSSGPINIPEPELLVASIDIGDTLQLCPDNGVTDITLSLTGGTGLVNADWGISPAINQIDSSLIQFTPSVNSLDQMYHVQVQDENGCITQDSIFIGAILSVLSGQATLGLTLCNECEVFKYRHNSTVGLWELMDTATTNSDGDYDFGAISNLTPFSLQIRPNQIQHPYAPSQFYPEGHKWNDATVFTNNCGVALTKNFTLTEPLDFSGNGTNVLKGTVWYSSTGKTQTEDPIPLIDVVVEKTPPGQGRGLVTTDEDGIYEFGFVPNSDTIYTLFVSMPGIPNSTTTYEILANTGNEVYCELDFCLNEDSTEINICNGDGNPCLVTTVNSNSEESFMLYPNPTNGGFTIETGKFAETNAELRIVDTAGRVMFEKRYAETPYTINMVNVAEGYYLVQLMNEKDSDASPISVMRY
jgi:PKD repeat protein